MSKFCAILKKINGYIGLGVFAAMAVYALIMATPTANTQYYEDTLAFYGAIQPINDQIIYLALFGILWSVIYKLLRNDIRKIFYISNFVWHGVYTIYAIVASLLGFIGIAKYQAAWYALDFASINDYLVSHDKAPLNPNTSIFMIGYIVCGLVLVSAILVGIVGVYMGVKRVQHEKEIKAEAEQEAK